MLFRNFSRSNSRSIRTSESIYQFLDRCCWPEVGKVRIFLQTLLDAYPPDSIAELEARIKSGDNNQFESAIFELLIYAVLNRFGYQLIPHPEIDSEKNTRPDFQVITPAGDHFYLEAVTVSGSMLGTQNKSGSGRIIASVLEQLNSYPHHHFFLIISMKGEPRTQPSVKRLKHDLFKWLDSLCPLEIEALIAEQGVAKVPSFVWTHEDWRVEFQPFPYGNNVGAQQSRLIGVEGYGVGSIDRRTLIRNAIRNKGGKYGELNAPLLIAVNVVTPLPLRESDEMEALFGQEAVAQVVGSDGTVVTRLVRKPNGAWLGRGPQYTRVGGAWIFRGLDLFTVSQCKYSLYFNPWAGRSLPDCLARVPHWKVVENQAYFTEGLSLSTIFDLPKKWPSE